GVKHDLLNLFAYAERDVAHSSQQALRLQWLLNHSDVAQRPRHLQKIDMLHPATPGTRDDLPLRLVPLSKPAVSIPSCSGMMMSVITTSGSSSRRSAIPRFPSEAVMTSYPLRCRILESA